MNLGIFLSSGDSFTDMAKYGQDVRFKEFYVQAFSKYFDNVFIFSYANEKLEDLPKNVFIVPNKFNIPRLAYNLLLPFFNIKFILYCDIFRAYHLSGVVPAIITRIFFGRPFMFNYGYDYEEFVKIEGKYLQLLFLKIAHPLACNLASKIMAVTKIVLNWTPKNKTVYIPNGVDIKLFKPIKTLKKHNKKFLILAIGRLEVQKNYFNLLKAVENLDIRIKIIGRGSLKNKIVRFAKRKKIKLELIEKIPNTKLPAIYNQADIFVLPSLTEGPVKVLLEAMSCGLPVVGANVRGINEIIKDNKNGIFCNTDPESIKSALIKLIENKNLRNKLGKNARNEMVSFFNLDKLLLKEVRLLKSVKGL